MDARSAALRPYQAAEPAYPSYDWRRQIFLFRRRLALFVAVFAIGLALCVVAILTIPQRYVAAAEVIIDVRREQVVELRQVLPDLPTDAAAVDTEVEVLKARSLAETVTSRLKLDLDPEFNARWTLPGITSQAASPTRRRDAAVDRVMRRLRVDRLGSTYVIAIGFSATSPEKAASIANTFTDLYLQQQLDAKSDAARRASNLLSSRLDALRGEVETAERAVERYKAAHGLMTLSDAQGATITEQEISSLDAEMATARNARAEAQARLSAAQSRIAGDGKGDDLGEVLNSPVVQELRKQRDETAKQIAELQGRYGPRHPDLLKAQRQLTELDAQIQQEIGRVISNLKVQAGVAQNRSAAVAAALATAKTQLASNNTASVGLKELERNLESVRGLYQAFLDRFKQTSAQDGLAQSDARLISPAKVPLTASFPNRPLLFAAALVVSTLAALLAIWIAEAREDGVYRADDVQARLGLPCLALIPQLGASATISGGSPTDVVVNQPMSGFAEAFRTLKAGLFASGPSGPTRTVMVTSALPGEGKTTTCICLGRVMASAGAAVVVVDCDLRRRAMSRLLATAPKVGLLDVLAGAAALEDALILDAATGLHLLPLGSDGLAKDALLESPAMDRLLEDLRGRFKVVLLDTAPVLLVAETRLLAGKADAVLLIARWGKTPASAAADAVKVLDGAGASVTGAVLTQADLRHMGRRDYPYGADYYPFYRSEVSVGVRRPAPQVGALDT